MAVYEHEDIDDDAQPLVLDLGSRVIKYGFSGDDRPRVIVPNIIGKVTSANNVMIGMPVRDIYIGDEAQSKRGNLEMMHPMLNGIIHNFDLFEKVLHHVFYNEIKVAPEMHPLLITEHPLNPKYNREGLLEIAMETYNIPGVHFSIPGVLNYYASVESANDESGLFIDCGSGVTSVVPVYRGEVLANSIVRQNWAGEVCTDRLMQLLQASGHTSALNSREVIESMKIQIASLSQDDTPGISSTVISPAGEEVRIKREHILCMEPLFNPQVLGSDLLGIHQLAFSSLKSCPVSTHTELCNRIVLSGGSTTCPGFETRFFNELTQLLPADLSQLAHLIAHPQRKYTTWIGGSKFAVSKLFLKSMISLREYNEYGPSIAYRKCLL